MGQRTNLLLQVEGRSGARLNRVYHLQWGYRKYLPMAFLRLLSSRYFKPEKTDIFEFFTRGLDLDSLDMIERDWNKYDFNLLDECQDALSHCDNNNGAMVVVITEDARDYYHPKYKLGFLLGPEDLEGEPPFSRWWLTITILSVLTPQRHQLPFVVLPQNLDKSMRVNSHTIILFKFYSSLPL